MNKAQLDYNIMYTSTLRFMLQAHMNSFVKTGDINYYLLAASVRRKLYVMVKQLIIKKVIMVDLKETLELHTKWLKGETEGKRVNLIGADLSETKF